MKTQTLLFLLAATLAIQANAQIQQPIGDDCADWKYDWFDVPSCIRLVNKPNGANYAACAGKYVRTDEYSNGVPIYESFKLDKTINNKRYLAIRSNGQWACLNPNGKANAVSEMPWNFFHTSQNGPVIKDTTWNQYEIKCC